MPVTPPPRSATPGKPAKRPREPTPPWKIGVLIGGIAVVLLGCVLFYVGMKPLGPLMELFTGGAAAAEKHKDWLDHLNEHLANAAWPVGLGTVAFLVGFVMIKVGASGPKPKTVEEIVDEKVRERLAHRAALGGSGRFAHAPRAGAAVGPPARARPSGAAGRPCSYCRRALRPSDTFCVYCGTPAP